MKKNILYIALILAFYACSDDSRLDIKGLVSPNGEVVNTRFEQSVAYNDSVGEIHLDMHSDEYVVYVCTDSHITRKTHRNLDYFMAQYSAAATPKVAVHLGDIIDAQKNFPCADSIIHTGRTKLDTMFVTPGNHDIYFKQWQIFRSFFKTGTYWFDTNNGSKKLDLFVCLDSAEGTVGTKQLKWLRDLLANKSKEGYRRIVVYTHTNFWKVEGSLGTTPGFPIEETYELAALFAQYGVDFVWSGHYHARQSAIYKGVNYLVLDATKDQEKNQAYMTVNMGESAVYHYYNYPVID
jgi:predicted phosphodiesterase